MPTCCEVGGCLCKVWRRRSTGSRLFTLPSKERVILLNQGGRPGPQGIPPRKVQSRGWGWAGFLWGVHWWPQTPGKRMTANCLLLVKGRLELGRARSGAGEDRGLGEENSLYSLHSLVPSECQASFFVPFQMLLSPHSLWRPGFLIWWKKKNQKHSNIPFILHLRLKEFIRDWLILDKYGNKLPSTSTQMEKIFWIWYSVL